MRKNNSILLCLFILVISGGIALSVGRYGVSVPGFGTENMKTVMLRVRAPRVAAAVLTGMALSLSGVVSQAIFRNLLVSPDILGVSSGACVGAAAAILLHLNVWGIEFCALAGGLCAVALSLSIPRLLKNQAPLMLVLSGIVTGGFMTALLGVLKYIADPEMELAAIVYWTMGSLASARPAEVSFFALWIIIPALLLFALRWKLNILSLGDSEAQSLGENAVRLRIIFIILTTALTSFAVSLSGTIGWVGLVIPHLARFIAGEDNRIVLPVTAFLGAEFLIITDTLARTISASEIPLSILTGLLGTPLFVWLLVRRRLRIAE